MDGSMQQSPRQTLSVSRAQNPPSRRQPWRSRPLCGTGAEIRVYHRPGCLAPPTTEPANRFDAHAHRHCSRSATPVDHPQAKSDVVRAHSGASSADAWCSAAPVRRRSIASPVGAWSTSSGPKIRCLDRPTAPPPCPSIEHQMPVAVLHQCSVARQVTGLSRHRATRRLVTDLRKRH
jgi:hypothetical protein